MDITLTINGERRTLPLEDPRVTLLDALRQHLDLPGTKKGCDHGQCGACTVMLNGRRINACLTLAVMHQGDEITTIEGLGTPEALSPLQAAFIRHDGFQCGYCTPGQIVSATAMLAAVDSGSAQMLATTLPAFRRASGMGASQCSQWVNPGPSRNCARARWMASSTVASI